MKGTPLLTLFAILVFAVADLDGQTWTFTIGPGGSAETIVSADLKTNDMAVRDAVACIKINCVGIADCDSIALRVEERAGTEWKLVATLAPERRDTPGERVFALKSSYASEPNRRLVFSRGGKDVKFYNLKSDPGEKPPSDVASGPGKLDAIDKLLIRLCPGEYRAARYDEENNIAEVILTPTGNILSSQVESFDENDKLRVKVVADSGLLPLLKVKRTSAFRNRGVVRIVGEGVQVGVARQAAGETKPRCGTAEFLLQDFEPGKGVVEISLIGDPDRTVGEFEFNVNPLYSGIFSLGVVRTQALDPEYKLISTGLTTNEMVVIDGNSGGHDLLYALFFTPYIWGKRDLEKSYRFYRYINPTFGITLTDLSHNALLGLTVDVPQGVLFTIGAHLRRVKTLDKSAQIVVGQPFTTTKSPGEIQLPTSNEVVTKLFFAVSIDLHAAAALVSNSVRTLVGN